MARIDLPALTQWITAAAVRCPDDLAAVVMLHTGCTRTTATRTVRRLVDLQWLAQEGTPRRPLHRPGLLRQAVQRYAIDGLAEDVAWSRDFAPFFRVPVEVQRMTQHAFSELVNNAIDHSGGTQVTVSLRQTPSHVQLLVSDDGRGLFDRLGESFGLVEPALAMLELSKGKLTSRPDAHTGRGLFFTSKLADVFDLHANASAYQRRDWRGNRFRAARPMLRSGTSVFAAIALDTPRTLESVLRAHSLDGAGYTFDRTEIPLSLLVSDGVGLDSRAQARRVAARLDHFRHADIDFSGIPYVGHGFADELFRVQARLHAQVRIAGINMAPAVAAMVASVQDAG